MKGIKLIADKKLTTKTTFLVEIDGAKTRFLAKETFKNGTTKYYPFYEKDGKIEPKYKSIKCITVEPKTIVKSGISFTESKGFGFTNPKGVSNLFYFFQDKFPKINEVIISSNSDTKIEGTKFIIKLQDFEKLEEQTANFVENKKNEGQNLIMLVGP